MECWRLPVGRLLGALGDTPSGALQAHDLVGGACASADVDTDRILETYADRLYCPSNSVGSDEEGSLSSIN
jgi:hypothetical protein